MLSLWHVRLGLGAASGGAFGPPTPDDFAPSMLDAFKHDPAYMAGSALFTLVGVGVALAALSARRTQQGATVAASMAIGLGLLALGVGVFGTVAGYAMTSASISHPDLTDHDRQRLAHVGRAEAAYHGIFGAAAGALPVLLGVWALASAARRRRGQAPTLGP